MEELKLPFTLPAFREAWGSLLETKKWRKKTDTQLKYALGKLAKYHEDFATQLVEIAIIGDWQGVVFAETDADYQKWLKSRSNTKQTISTASFDRFEEQKRRIAEREQSAVPMPDHVRENLGLK